MSDKIYDLIIIGAGPIGIEAALYASETGLDFQVLEKDSPASNLSEWGFVKMFSPWKMNTSPLGLKKLNIKANGGYPSGLEMRTDYYLPLSQIDSITNRIIENFTVEHISRDQLLKGNKIGDPKRGDFPFLIYGVDSNGEEKYYRSKSVIDASGVYGQPNFLGRGGIPARGEKENSDQIYYHLIDLKKIDLANRKILVVGGGHSASTMIAQIEELSNKNGDISAVWLTTKKEFPVVRIENDPLIERAKIVERAHEIAAGSSKFINHLGGYWVDEIKNIDNKLEISLIDCNENIKTITCDLIFALVGYRPNRKMYEELQIHECYATAGPMKMASALLASDASSDCTADLDGGDEIYNNPEPNFYILGAKSYGRSTNFLIQKGHDQIKAVFKQITNQPDLDLYNQYE
jgi:thioredoxin reductase